MFAPSLCHSRRGSVGGMFPILKWSQPMKKLLMATDLSPRSDRALARAIRLASEHGAELIIAHVVDDGFPEPIIHAQETVAKTIIQDHVDALMADNQIDVSIEIVLSQAHVGILEMSERTRADLIVLGVHREDAFKDMYRGTTAERVIRASNVPVLLVKELFKEPYRQIMVGVDFSIYSRRAAQFAIRFAPEGQFQLVHAYDVPFKGLMRGQDTRRQVSQEQEAQFRKMVEEDMASFFASLDTEAPEIDGVMEEGPPREVLLQQAARTKLDLLVIGTHGRTGVAHVFLGSVAEDLLRAPPCDVLAVNAV